MTPDLLRRVGEALFGERWQSDLARQLGVNRRTVKRWTDGEWPIPEGIQDALRTILRERKGEIQALLR